MTPQDEAAIWFPRFIAWQERQRCEDQKRVVSILKAWGAVVQA